jgi:hypothetical protein
MTHGVWHDLIHASAAVVLAGGGGLLLGMAVLDRRRRRATPQPPRVGLVQPLAPPAPPDTALAVLIATLSVAAAVIHLAAAPGHAAVLGAAAWGFVAVAVCQAAWALAWGISATRTVALVGIVGNLAVVGGWAWSRLVGLPLGALAGRPEPIGPPDAAATLFELLLIGLLAAGLGGTGDRVARRLRDASSAATIAVVPAVGLVFLATTLAVSLALGHAHPAGAHGTP